MRTLLTADARPDRVGLDPVGLVAGVALAVDARGALVALDLRRGGGPYSVVVAERERRHQNGDRTWSVRCPGCLTLHAHGGEPRGWRQADCRRAPSYFVVTAELLRQLG